MMKTVSGNLPEEIFSSYPAVYAVEREYQIMVPVKKSTLMWCEVAGQKFYDEAGGILKCNVATHRMHVPAALLDASGSYKICWREMKKHLPYYPETGDEECCEFSFRPLQPGKPIRLFHIADAHNRIASPVAAARGAGELDLLVLNGDVPNDSSDIKNFAAIHQIAGEITKGEIPAVFSRGNHDLRGIYAEEMGEHTPTAGGNSYYTFRIGPLWGILLDCGEDKDDDFPAYGHVNVCHQFRLRQSEFLRQVIARKDAEYAAPGVEYRVVISHVPFPQIPPEPFNIEQDIYRDWCSLLKNEVHPQIFLAGHEHRLYVIEPGGELDDLGAPCPVVVGADPGDKLEDFTGAFFELTPQGAQVKFIDQAQQVKGELSIKF